MVVVDRHRTAVCPVMWAVHVARSSVESRISRRKHLFHKHGGALDMPAESSNIALIREYFRRGDSRDPATMDLFADDYQFYFPKWGISTGKAAAAEFGIVFSQQLDVYHNQDTLSFIESDNRVVVEGTTYGRDKYGVAWQGGETPGGRFCAVYEISDGRIVRNHIYADTDYTGRYTEGFFWGRDRKW
jgi:ketosteroid isomerase-like protein